MNFTPRYTTTCESREECYECGETIYPGDEVYVEHGYCPTDRGDQVWVEVTCLKCRNTQTGYDKEFGDLAGAKR